MRSFIEGGGARSEATYGRRRIACGPFRLDAAGDATPAVSCGSRANASGWRLRRPQLLEVVVRTHGRLHHVHDDVAGVDEDPLADILAFDAEDRRTGFLEFVADVVR